jgi:transaldolase/glucose-6-phosphate isomerase
MNPLKQLGACGQSPWLDYLKRSLIETGELRTLIERDGLKGLTSNPSIFEKAIADSDDYTTALAAFQAEGDPGISDIYEHLAIADIRAAADALCPVFEATRGRDGYVSLECSPYLANDTEGTVAEGLRLWHAVDRPNLMIKVPGTEAGIPAIRRLITCGLNVNVTLLFSVPVYERIAEAYIGALEDLTKSGGNIAAIASVASFFVSRIDTAVDARLDALENESIAVPLRGKVAIASGKLAYTRYQALFAGPRWEALAASGARTQRLLWASTSTKNPAFKDTMYVEALIGRDTVDTIAPATMDAFRDHGIVVADSIEGDVDEARSQIAALILHGISLEEVTRGLVEDGVRLFAESFDTLLGAVARHRRIIHDGTHPTLKIGSGSHELKTAIAAETDLWRKTGGIRKLWAGDTTLWTGSDENHALGWLRIVEHETADSAALRALVIWGQSHRFTDIVLLGMGGSSLGPEVLASCFGNRPGWPRFHMLDSTDPAQILTIERGIDMARTLFIVSSKSGSTLEPNIFLDHFLARVCAIRGKSEAGAHFIAVTDPDSPLDRRAAELGFAHIFHGAKSIGGRYSVLSKFGMVPAAAMGIDVGALLRATRSMERSCGPDVPPSENPGVQLGIALGVAATRFGRDKVTLVTSPGIADLGSWLEQLLAESTGKQGHGLIPLAGEKLGTPDRYGDDRFFAYLELEGDGDGDVRAALSALEAAGHPVARIRVPSVGDIGQEFFRWEIATAVAGAIIGIDPFDQPDVEASKVKTTALTDAYEKTRQRPKDEPIFRENGLALHADPRNAAEIGRHSTLAAYLKSHFGRVGAGDYVALLAYIERNAAHTTKLSAMRTCLRDATKAATCLGYGPRFQHSTGQAYKGGPNTGVFLQITCDDPIDLGVPGHAYSFGLVKAAQASGDLEVLVERGRRVLRVHMKNVDAGLTALARAIDAALD